MTQIELFAGIGGFGLAGEWAGIKTVCQVEIDPFCQRVLAKNFPNAYRHDDIYTFDGTAWRGCVDVISGGFPCQPYSHAGKRQGNDDDRALWPQMLRVIREAEPEWVVGENVAGLLGMDGGRVFAGIVTDLENAGYTVEAFVIPACAVGAPHRRDRVWIVAHRDCEREQQPEGSFGDIGRRFANIGEECAATNAKCSGWNGRPPAKSGNVFGNGHDGEGQGAGEFAGKAVASSDTKARGVRCRQTSRQSGLSSCGFKNTANAYCAGCQKCNAPEEPGSSGFGSRPDDSQWNEHWLPAATRLCRVDDGLPRRVDRSKRLKALGNAIVPQVAYQIFNAIKQLNHAQI